MCITRTKKDVLKAYQVYKYSNIYTKNIPDCDKGIYTLLSTMVVLYEGLTKYEIASVLPISANCIKKLIRNGIYKYGLFDYDERLVLGRDVLGDVLGRGVITLKKGILAKISLSSAKDNVTPAELDSFATLLSNTSSHVNIIKKHVMGISSKLALAHINFLFNAIVNKKTDLENSCVNNLEMLGYMRIRNANVELNKKALTYSKEPCFELRPV